MQTPESEKSEEAKQIEQQPLYEFPPSAPSFAPAEEEKISTDSKNDPLPKGDVAESKHAALPPVNEDLIRQGLVYPPPPSFYQQSAPLPPPPLAQPMAASTPVAPPYPGQVPPFGSPPQKKKSYRWLWITISILAVLLLAACGFCGWSFYNFFASAIGPAENTVNVANNYYAALQSKDYSSAFGYVTPQGTLGDLTLDSFTKQAQDTDTRFGAIRSFKATMGNFSTDSSKTSVDLSRFTVVVNVTREKQSYSVLLTLQKSGSTWKIVDFDRM